MPEHGKLGRIPTPPEVRARNFKLQRYLAPGPAPKTWDASAGVTDWPMYLNDSLGDCTAAAAGHQLEVWTREVDGVPREVSDQDVLALYETQGYVPGDPSTDQGATCQGVLDSWRKVGLGGDLILGYAEIDVRGFSQLEQGLWLFSGLYIGFDVPQSALDQFDAGEPWIAVTNDGGIVGGHCVNVVAYDAQGLTVITWGQRQVMDWAFWHRYVGEAYVAIPQDYDRLQARPLDNGFNEAQLIADLNALGGNVAPPPPAPVPIPPAPVPPAPAPPPPGYEDWLDKLEDVPEEIAEWLWSHIPAGSGGG
jgi:hypothetical protein